MIEGLHDDNRLLRQRIAKSVKQGKEQISCLQQQVSSLETDFAEGIGRIQAMVKLVMKAVDTNRYASSSDEGASSEIDGIDATIYTE